MTRKKVIFIGPPFSGHLHPLLGIAKRMSEVADIAVWSTPGAAAECAAPFRPILREHEARVWEIAEPGRGVKGNPLRLWRQLRQNVALMAEMNRELDEALREEAPDLVIADFTVPVAGLSASRLGIEWWTTLPSPCVLESPDGPPAYFGGQTPDQSALKLAGMRLATRVFKRLMWRVFRRELQAIGFDGVYRADGSEAVYSPRCILGLGAREIEFPRSLPPHFHFAGPVFHTPPYRGPEPAYCEGKPHVLVSLGTHLQHEKAALATAVRDIAARHPGIEFHFTHGRAAGPPPSRDGNFHALPFISYSEHLARYAAVVHHAGAGVMHHCLLHGVPAVAHPLDFDQFDNAARLIAAGVAVLARKRGDLEAAILTALRDSDLKRRCEEMREAVRRYDAPGRVVALFCERFLAES